MPKITPFLWFDTQAEEAAEFYVSVFPNSRIDKVLRNGEGWPGPKGAALTVEFELDGETVVAMNGGPHQRLSEAFSFAIECRTQAEVDHYWEKLVEGGGSHNVCGWLKDRFGLSWQVTPTVLLDLIADPDPARATRALKAMMGMSKIDIAELERAVG